MIYKLAVVGDAHLVPVDSPAILGPPIIRTCWEARQAGLREFYSSHTPEFEIRWSSSGVVDFSNFRRWLARVGTDKLDMIRTANIVVPPHTHLLRPLRLEIVFSSTTGPTYIVHRDPSDGEDLFRGLLKHMIRFWLEHAVVPRPGMGPSKREYLQRILWVYEAFVTSSSLFEV